MSWSHIQKASAAGTAGVAPIATFPGPTPVGRLVVVGVAGYGGPTTVQDNNGNTYINVLRAVAGSNFTEIFYAIVTNPGTLAVTPIGAGYGAIAIDEFSATGLITLDASNSSTGSSASPASGNVAITGNDLVCAYSQDNQAGEVYTAGSGYTLSSVVPMVGGVNVGIAGEYQLNQTAGPVNPGFSLSVSTVWVTAGVSFKATSSGGASPMLVRPSSIHPKHAAPITLHLIGTGTAWAAGSTVTVTNSVTGTTTVTKGTWTALTPTTATLTITTGVGVGTWKLTIDGVDSPPLHVRGYRGRWFPGLSYSRRYDA